MCSRGPHTIFAMIMRVFLYSRVVIICDCRCYINLEVRLKNKPAFSYRRLPSHQQYTTGAMAPVLPATPPPSAVRTMNGAWLTRRRVPIATAGVRLPRRHTPRRTQCKLVSRETASSCASVQPSTDCVYSCMYVELPAGVCSCVAYDCRFIL